MKLIICEKPSLMRKVIEALKTTGEHFTAKDNKEFYESEHFIATSQFGHLVELKDISEYDCNKGKNMWKSENLPFFPDQYELVVMEDTRKRFNTIKKLLNRVDVDEVLHCGDPDREGQILVDLVLEKCGCKKKVTRPLLKALTNEAILQQIKERKDNSNYINWHNEGLVRMYLDNDFGKNLSRYATDKSKAKPALSIGRVVSAIVTEIYLRDKAIAEFKPEKNYKIESEVNDIKLTSKKEFSFNDYETALNYATQLNSHKSVVKDIVKKRVKKKSPKLFSQTGLQGEMNKQHKLSPDQTLSIAQALYEKGYISYPRTNTEYIAEGEKDDIKRIISSLNDTEITFKDEKSIFDDSKIDGHSAITPTTNFPSSLSDLENKCYALILNRFKAVFCKELCLYDKTEVKISCGEVEDFSLKGESLISLGWQKFEGKNKEDKILPPLKLGQIIPTDFQPKEAETSPPKPYTVESLGKWMQNPFRKNTDTEEDAYKKILAGVEIGTEATRAPILKKAQDKKYIALKKSTYSILPDGIANVEICKELGIDMSSRKTAQMGMLMKQVYKGEKTVDEVLNIGRKEIFDIITANKDVKALKSQSSSNIKDSGELGKCPICGKPIIENAKAYGCSSYKEGCKFTIWKSIAGKKITAAQAKKIIKGETTAEIKGFKSKAGKEFSAKLKLKDDKSGVTFVF